MTASLRAALIGVGLVGLVRPAVAQPSDCELDNRAPLVDCPLFVEVAVDDNCEWGSTAPEIAANFADPDGDELACDAVPAGRSVGLGVVPVAVWCVDDCGAQAQCETLLRQHRPGLRRGGRRRRAALPDPLRRRSRLRSADLGPLPEARRP